MSAELVPLSTHPAAGLLAIGTPTVIDAWLRARNPNTVRGYHSDLERFREWLGVPSAAAAIEALLSGGQAAANLMVMNYVAALVERVGRRDDRPPACRLAVDGQDRPQDRPDELESRRRGTESRGRRDMRGPDLLDVRLLWRAAIGAGTDPRARRDRAILACLFDLGLRRAELCNLDRTDIEAGADGRPAAVWIRGKGRTEKERRPCLIKRPPPWSNGSRPAATNPARSSIASTVPSRLRTFDFPGNRSAGSFADWASPPACPGTFAPMDCATARRRLPSMLAAISGTSGASLAFDLSRWSYGMTT